MASDLERGKDFFNTIESKPLTQEQRLSVVVDEDATLVLAGAGSGKTSVITAKAAYLVKAGIRKPDKILLLAFAKNAAAEMSERVPFGGYAARTFVSKNPAQIAKQIVPAGTASEPAIKIRLVAKDGDQQALGDVLQEISARVGPSSIATVLLLGRYRFLEPDMPDLQRRFPRLRITFKTIHASKGLEADHVILLDADSGRTGFPSETVDDPLLSLVSPEAEAFENAEERRVMYVAMTRARHTLTILASKSLHHRVD